MLIVLDGDDANAALSFRNIPNVHVLPSGELNAYDVLVSDTVVFTQSALPTADAPKQKKAAAPAAAKAAPAETSADAPSDAVSEEEE